MIEVTIVIPVFNRAAFLPRLFEALRMVNYQKKHVILVDNGSEDDSMHLCQDFAEHADFPTKVISAPEKGAAAARNAELDACSTAWVYFFDSDDWFSPAFP